MEAQLVSQVHHHISLHLYDNAKFLCERLVAEVPSEANKLLLGTCYYHANQGYRTYHLLQGTSCPHARYLLALCCLELGKLDEAELALQRKPDDPNKEVPNGAAGLYLLGKVARQTNRQTMAIEHFRQALRADPLMWCAYEELCQMGAGETASCVLTTCERGLRQDLEQQDSAEPGGVEGTLQTPKETAGAWAGTRGSLGSRQGRENATPGTPGTPFTTTPPSDTQPPISGPPPLQRPGGGAAAAAASVEPGTRSAPRRSARRAGGAAAAGANASAALATPGTIDSAPGWERRKFGIATEEHRRRPADDTRFKLRKVTDKLFQESDGVAEEGTPVLGDSATTAASTRMAAGLPGGEDSTAGLIKAVQLMLILGEGTRQLTAFHCKQAVAAFEQLPDCQFNTSWVLCQVAKAHFEEVDYPMAARLFERAHLKDPCRVEDMEIYSTVLWHMKREIELSYLAQELISVDRLCPQAWCVMGNCFSLQKEHETALKLFQRALQLDSNFTYAHTLCGHEFFSNEDFDKSLACYRTAVRIDRRHYNAWYGIGQIYLRQEKYDLAENHFRRALHINPGSSVLLCYLGMALHKLDRHNEALENLQAAINADSHNPLARYEKAQVLQTMESNEEALEELEELKSMLPKESSVYFQMGKIYKKLDNVKSALVHFNTALDLKPPTSDINLIKNAIEKIHVPEAAEDEEI